MRFTLFIFAFMVHDFGVNSKNFLASPTSCLQKNPKSKQYETKPTC